jgi:acylphosphatase
MDVGVRMIADGVVQGVGFRFFVQREAESLSLKGYAKNLYDGSVEIVAEGNRSLIEEFIAVVKVGPRMAHVAKLSVEWLPVSNTFTEFETL